MTMTRDDHDGNVELLILAGVVVVLIGAVLWGLIRLACYTARRWPAATLRVTVAVVLAAVLAAAIVTVTPSLRYHHAHGFCDYRHTCQAT